MLTVTSPQGEVGCLIGHFESNTDIDSTKRPASFQILLLVLTPTFFSSLSIPSANCCIPETSIEKIQILLFLSEELVVATVSSHTVDAFFLFHWLQV